MLSKLLLLVFVISLFFTADLEILFAAAQLFEGYGECIMGDTGVENTRVAQDKARELALRNASEQASLVIQSVSEMKDNNLTKDQIIIFSGSILKLEGTPTITNETIPNAPGAIRYKCYVKVWIDPDEFLEKFIGIDTEKAEDQLKMSKDQDNYREQNETEIAGLRKQYKDTEDDNKRKEIVAAIKRNEEKVTASQLYQRGSECYNRGDLAEATKFYNQAIEMDKMYAAPWTGLGWIYNDKEEYLKAIECFRKSVELYDSFAVPYNGLSYAYNYSKDYNKAIEYGNKAVQLDSGYAAAWNNIGLAYNNLGNLDKAVEYYNKAISTNTKDEIPMANIGNVYYKQKNFAKALEYYQKAIKINPKHANVWYNLGNIYGQQGEIDKAVDSYKKVVSIDSQNIRAWIILGYLYNSQKKFEDAKSSFKKALKINSNDASAWAGLGFAYDGSEDYSNSYEAYKKAVELEPNNENYKKNLEIAKQKL